MRSPRSSVGGDVDSCLDRHATRVSEAEHTGRTFGFDELTFAVGGRNRYFRKITLIY